MRARSLMSPALLAVCLALTGCIRLPQAVEQELECPQPGATNHFAGELPCSGPDED